MGGTAWSDEHYHSNAVNRRLNKRSAFAYDEDIRMRKKAAGVHPKMDPALMKNGRRESRDSELHLDSRAVAVFFDVTGTFGERKRLWVFRFASTP